MNIERSALIMLVSTDKEEWVSQSLPSECELYQYDDIREALRTLANISCDLIIIDESLPTSTPISPVITEIKRRFPYIPLVVIAESNDTAYHEKLHAAGADDVITDRLPKKQLQFHITMLLKQQNQNQVLVKLNHNLQLMATLSQLLYNAADPYTLILQAIKFIRAAFNLYGLVFILKEGEAYRMYAGGEEVVSKNKLHESIVRPDENNPLLWTIKNRSIQIYRDIKKYTYYRPISILSRPEAVAYVPLTYQQEVIGAMGIFAMPGQLLTHEDLIVYERFGAQLIYSLQNANQHRTQRSNLQANQQLLRAWQIFADLQDPLEIARALCRLIEEIPNIQNSFVWFNADERGNFEEILADAQGGQLMPMYNQIRKRGLLGTIVQGFSDETQPVIVETEPSQDPALAALSRIITMRRLTTLPISSSGQLLGGIITGIADDVQYGSDELNQISTLSYIAGQAVERTLLNLAVNERTNRLEAILRSVSEGIFFVDDMGKVAFCTPQVSELTDINTVKVLQQDVEILFNELANRTANVALTSIQLADAKMQIVGTQREDVEKEYPILSLQLAANEQMITIEFLRIEGLNNRKISWAGVVRSEEEPAQRSKFQNMMVTALGENFRMPYAQVRSLIATLADQHGHFSYRERDQVLHQIENSFERLGSFVNNYLDMQSLEFGSLTLNREAVKIDDMLYRVLSNRQINKLQRHIQFDRVVGLPTVRLDEFRIAQALTDVVQYILEMSRGTVTVQISGDAQAVQLTFNGEQATATAEQVRHSFDPVLVIDGQMAGGLYISREVIRRHGGHSRAEISSTTSGAVLTITIVLPTAGALIEPVLMPALFSPSETLATKPPAATPVSVAAPLSPPAMVPTVPAGPPVQPAAIGSQESRETNGSRSPSRNLSRIMLVEGASSLTRTISAKLQAEDYELFSYRQPEVALEELPTIRFDLVIIDATVGDMGGIELTRRIRQMSEVPLILLADKATDAERVQGLNSGADDYITKPISDDELLVRVQLIFKRQYISTRVSEPIVINDLYIDLARRQVFIANKPIDLTRIEYDLLYHLVINRGQVLTHRQLLEKVWGPDYADETHYLWVNISRLRKKLELRPCIHTQQGIGYYFDM